MCNRSHICGYFEGSIRVSGLVPDVSEFWILIVERKRETSVTNGSNENDAQPFMEVTRAHERQDQFKVTLKLTEVSLLA